MGSNTHTHTHQHTQLTIVTNIIEREFVAIAILSLLSVVKYSTVQLVTRTKRVDLEFSFFLLEVSVIMIRIG